MSCMTGCFHTTVTLMITVLYYYNGEDRCELSLYIPQKYTFCILTGNFQPPMQQKLWNIHLQFLYAKDMNQSHDMSHDIYTLHDTHM